MLRILGGGFNVLLHSLGGEICIPLEAVHLTLFFSVLCMIVSISRGQNVDSLMICIRTTVYPHTLKLSPHL
jgi:hypothetical protein